MLSVAMIGVLLLAAEVLTGQAARQISGAVIICLAVVPFGFSARATPTFDDDDFRRRQWAELGLFVLGIAVCALGLILLQP